MHAIRGWPDTGHSTTFNMGECGNIHTFPKIFMYYTKSLAWFYGFHPNTATASDQARRAELSRMRMRLLCMNNSVRLIAIITELLVAIKPTRNLFTARWCHSSKCHSSPDHPTLEHICVCTNLAEIDLSPSVYCSAYHSTTNYLSSVCYSWSLYSSNCDVLTTIGKSVLCWSCKFGRDCGHFSRCLSCFSSCCRYIILLPATTRNNH